MLLEGWLAELIAIMAPQVYGKYVTVNAKGRKVLFVKIQKALYGMLESTLLFYKKLVDDLKRVGFSINPYDPCMASIEIEGKHMTRTWHVDDLKMCHVDANGVEKMIKYLKSTYGQKIAEKRGKVHDYLEMIIDYTKRGEGQISMIPYINQSLKSFQKRFQMLFEVRDKEEAVPLNEEKTQLSKTVCHSYCFSCFQLVEIYRQLLLF